MRAKPAIELIPAIYRSSFEDIALFMWVEGQKRIIPTITVEQSIGLFIGYVGGNWDIVNLSTTYYRMQKKYYDSQRLQGANPA
jgi:hypothetical protein